MTSYLMLGAIWRICIILAPLPPNYPESCAYQAVKLFGDIDLHHLPPDREDENSIKKSPS